MPKISALSSAAPTSGMLLPAVVNSTTVKVTAADIVNAGVGAGTSGYTLQSTGGVVGWAPLPDETGWAPAGETWTYASTATFTVAGDKTAKYQKGTKIKCTNSTVKYLYVTAATYSNPNTTVTVTGGSDCSLENAAITSPLYSYIENPQGFPCWFNYTPVWASGGTPPAIVNGTLSGRFNLAERTVTARIYQLNGSSTTYGTSYYVWSLPVSPLAGNPTYMGVVRAIDNGTGMKIGVAEVDNANNRVALYSDAGLWGQTTPITWAVSDSLTIHFSYEMA